MTVTTSRPELQIGYLTNSYPGVSHSFIKREILALEAQGCIVHRWSIRPCVQDLPDPTDQLEASRTTVILSQRLAIVRAVLLTLLLKPYRSWTALRASCAGRPAGVRSLITRFAYFAEACLLVRQARSRRIDHLHVHFGTNPATVAMLAHILGGPPYSFTVHGPDEFDQPIVHALSAKVAASRFVVAISNFGRSQLMRWTEPECWDKINVVRCGLDDTFLAEPDRVVTDFSDRQLCCVARLAPQKGLPILVKAAEQLKLSGVDFKIVVIGDGPLRGWMVEEIRRRNLETVFDLRGWASADDVRQALQNSKAFVLPSFAEGLPVVIMEALALERPVISTRIAGIGELVDSECGWLVDAGEVGQLVGAMKQALASGQEDWQRMGRVGRARAIEMHDAQTNARTLLSLILRSREQNQERS